MFRGSGFGWRGEGTGGSFSVGCDCKFVHHTSTGPSFTSGRAAEVGCLFQALSKSIPFGTSQMGVSIHKPPWSTVKTSGRKPLLGCHTWFDPVSRCTVLTFLRTSAVLFYLILFCSIVVHWMSVNPVRSLSILNVCMA